MTDCISMSARTLPSSRWTSTTEQDLDDANALGSLVRSRLMAARRAFPPEADTAPATKRTRDTVPAPKSKRPPESKPPKRAEKRWAGSGPPTPRTSFVRPKKKDLPKATLEVDVTERKKDARREDE